MIIRCILNIFAIGFFSILIVNVLFQSSCLHASHKPLKSSWFYIPEEELDVGNHAPEFEYLHTGLTRTGHSSNVLENEQEALNSLQAALEMRRLARDEKAARLFEHALALCPRQPDVLNEYGEFLESSARDVTGADQLYQRALSASPGHGRALENRRRTMPLVMQVDLKQLNRIDRKRRELADVPDSSSALRRIKKEAYFQQIHHTTSIEGNTMTLAETRFVVETRMAVSGRSVMEHNEILGLDAAIKFINTTLVHRIGDIRLEDVLEIHRRVMGHTDPLEAGYMRTTQVYVSQHRPPPPARLHPLMEAFIAWLNDSESLALHPVKYAALAHYKLVFIHPFSDGNGRTSRLLMNLIMMQAGFPPVIIRKQDRHLYYRYLQLANEGDVRPFIRFIGDCAEKTLDVYLWATTQYVHKIGSKTNGEQRRPAGSAPTTSLEESAEYAFIRNYCANEDEQGLSASKAPPSEYGEPVEEDGASQRFSEDGQQTSQPPKKTKPIYQRAPTDSQTGDAASNSCQSEPVSDSDTDDIRLSDDAYVTVSPVHQEDSYDDEFIDR